MSRASKALDANPQARDILADIFGLSSPNEDANLSPSSFSSLASAPLQSSPHKRKCPILLRLSITKRKSPLVNAESRFRLHRPYNLVALPHASSLPPTSVECAPLSTRDKTNTASHLSLLPNGPSSPLYITPPNHVDPDPKDANKDVTRNIYTSDSPVAFDVSPTSVPVENAVPPLQDLHALPDSLQSHSHNVTSKLESPKTWRSNPTSSSHTNDSASHHLSPNCSPSDALMNNGDVNFTDIMSPSPVQSVRKVTNQLEVLSLSKTHQNTSGFSAINLRSPAHCSPSTDKLSYDRDKSFESGGERDDINQPPSLCRRPARRGDLNACDQTEHLSAINLRSNKESLSPRVKDSESFSLPSAPLVTLPDCSRVGEPAPGISNISSEIGDLKGFSERDSLKAGFRGDGNASCAVDPEPDLKRPLIYQSPARVESPSKRRKMASNVDSVDGSLDLQFQHSSKSQNQCRRTFRISESLELIEIDPSRVRAQTDLLILSSDQQSKQTQAEEQSAASGLQHASISPSRQCKTNVSVPGQGPKGRDELSERRLIIADDAFCDELDGRRIGQKSNCSFVEAILESILETVVVKSREMPASTVEPSFSEQNVRCSHSETFETLQNTEQSRGDLEANEQHMVLIWDAKEKRRSSNFFSVQDALGFLKVDASYEGNIYDGQDFDFTITTSSGKVDLLGDDRKNWAGRDVMKKPVKVRIWDPLLRTLLPYHQSPDTNTLLSFLSDHSNLRVFHPRFVCMPNDSQIFIELRKAYKPPLTLPQVDCVDGYIGKSSNKALVLLRRIIQRIRWNRTLDLHETRLKEIRFWNINANKCEGPLDFSCRAALTLYLLQNPHLQLLQSLDKLRAFESRSGFHLIPLYLHCPARLTYLWDSIRKQRYVHLNGELPANGSGTVEKTLGCFIGPLSQFALYVGQDLNEARFLKKMLKRKVASGSVPWQHVLANCGLRVQRDVYDRDWIPCRLDINSCMASCVVFWNEQSQSVMDSSDEQNHKSVKEYLELQHGNVQLYRGQDLEKETRKELDNWFQVLRYQPGYAASHLVSALLRPWMAYHIRSGYQKMHSKQLLDNGDDVASPVSVDIDHHSKEVDTVQYISSDEECVVFEVPESPVNLESDNGRTQLTLRTNSPQPFPTSHLTQKIEQCSDRPRTRAESGRRKVSSVVTDLCTADGGDTEDGMDVWNMEDVQAPGIYPELLEPACKRVIRVLSSIREAGTKIFRRELTRDLRQQLREELILHVRSVEDLSIFVTEVEKVDFAKGAWELYKRIEQMDVYDFFGPDVEQSLAPPSLGTLKRDIEKGRICFSTELMSRFRQTFIQLTDFYGESMMGNVAAELLIGGEDLFRVFVNERKRVIDLEGKILKLMEITEAANKVGFIKQPGKRKARSTEPLISAAKVSIRSGGSEPMVTFMNCRDEKGHAVMGKQQSVRILGLSIDLRECERRVGQVHTCHFCRQEVREGAGGILKCGNWIFDICCQVVCRVCAERFLGIDFLEFCKLRGSERWFCPHCRGFCSASSLCHRNGTDEGCKDESTTEVIRLWWRNSNWRASKVRMNIVKRSLNGEFHRNNSRVVELWESEAKRNLWERTVRLPIGAYRCGVFLDEVEVASTCFQVYKSATNKLDGSIQLEADDSIEKKLLNTGDQHSDSNSAPLGEDFIKAEKNSGRRHIAWDLSPHTFVHGSVKSYKCHAICEDEMGSRLIENCSRTEGYDWRRAKFHPIATWVPHIVDGAQVKTRKRNDRAVYSTNDWMWRGWLRRGRPVVSVGVSFREATVRWNTFMYKNMLKKLWGIVAGRSEIHGVGLFTLTGYERGEMVIEYAGDLIRTPLGDIRESEYQGAGLGTYLFKLNEEQIVDATVNSNRARFTNHSCDPNMMANIITIAGRELVVLRAIRRIPKYAELTFDYQLPYEEDEKLNCLCNAANCVGVMN